MPEKFGQKALFMIMNLLGTLAIMFIVLAATNSLGKADIEYVDKQDAVTQKNLDTYKDDHKAMHTETEKRMDLTVNYLERMMENLNIQYKDLKDEVDERE